LWFERKPIKLKDIHLVLPLKNTVNGLDDLTLAIHKFDVDKPIAEQEWKIKQPKFGYRLCIISCWCDYYRPCHD
jgi:hypothetical protein